LGGAALVLFAAGQDSATRLAWALDRLTRVETTGFDLGMDRRFVVHTPLMWIDRADTFALAHDFGGEPLIDVLVQDTHTCYLGDRARRHEWGWLWHLPGLRADGFAKWKTERTAPR
jgi:7-cyano-7-deazaguanine synthase